MHKPEPATPPASNRFAFNCELEVGPNLAGVFKKFSLASFLKLKESIMSEVNDALADLQATVAAEKAEVVAMISALEERINQGQDNAATLAQIAEIKAQVQGIVNPEETA